MTSIVTVNTVQIDDLLGTGTGRKHIDQIANMLLIQPQLLDHLISIMISNREPESRKAAWVVDTFTETRMELLTTEALEQLIDTLPHCCHTALHRHILRILTRSTVPASRTGKLISLCFDFLNSGNEPVAVKAQAMTILYKLSGEEPDLLYELSGILELRMESESAGFRNLAKKILQALNKRLNTS